MFTVRDIMTDHVVIVDPDDPIQRAIDLMLRHRVSGLPVVDASGQLLGVISEFDVLAMVDDAQTELDKVYHYMNRDLQTVEASMSVLDLAAKFRERSFRRYPVVDNGRLVGIVSRRELIRLVRDIRARVHHLQEAATVSS